MDGLSEEDKPVKKPLKKDKLTGCDLCTREGKAHTPFLGREPDFTPSDVMIVVGMPTNAEDTTGIAFSSQIHHSLDKVLREAGLTTYSMEWAYASPCYHSGKEKLTPAIEKRCHQDLIQYLRACGCKYALLVGASAMNIFSNGKHKAITKERGGVIECEGVTAVPVSDYADVLRDLELLSTFKADLGFFSRLITSTFAKVDANMAGKIYPRTGSSLFAMTPTCLSYDIESEGFNHRKGAVKMVGVAWRSRSTGQVATGIMYPKETPFNVDARAKWEWPEVADVITSVPRTAAHNSKFDNGWLKSRGLPAHTSMDTMLAAYCDNHMMPHNLKFLAKHLLHAPHYNEGIDFNDNSDEMRDKMEYYCQLDCYYTLLLREYYLEHKLEFGDVPGDYKKVLAKLLMPGTRVLERIEARGVHVDKSEVEQVGEFLVGRKDDTKYQLLKLLPEKYKFSPAGISGTINFDSPTQLRKLLYGKKSEGGFGYKPIYKERDPEDDDDPTTGKAALTKLARAGSEFCKVLLEYRSHSKALSGFIDPWLEMLGETGNRLFPSYNIGRTATGRLSANNPNLQQVSRDRLIRNLIKPTPGWLFVEADFSQIELRVASWIGRIASMKKVFDKGGDIHISTAKAIAKLGGRDWDALMSGEIKAYRQRSKAVNFGLIFGMGAEGFQEYASSGYDIDLTLSEAKAYRAMYMGMYPEVQDWHDRARAGVSRDKYTRTPFGRVRRLPNADSVDKRLVSKALRCGMNTPVQSAASDITLLAMIDLEEAFEKLPNTVRMIGQCHDAIFFEVRPERIDIICQYIHDIMLSPRLDEFDLYMDVPLDVEIKIGRCWSDPDGRVFKPVVAT